MFYASIRFFLSRLISVFYICANQNYIPLMKYCKNFLLYSFFVLLFLTTFTSLQAQGQDCCCENGEVTSAGFDDCSNACFFEFGVSGEDCVAAPVTLAEFSGAADKYNHVLLEWGTTTESDNMGFEVERADASLGWKTVEFVNGSGTRTERTTYSFLDRTPFIGTNFYRLKQIDFNGEFTYSEVIVVSAEGNRAGIATVFPTVTRDELFIRYHSELEASSVVAAIYNVNGKLVRKLKTTNARLDVSGLETGHYVVVFTYKGQTYTERFLRSR